MVSMIVFRAFSAISTCFLDSFKYFRTSSFPPPGCHQTSEVSRNDMICVRRDCSHVFHIFPVLPARMHEKGGRNWKKIKHLHCIHQTER